MSLIFLVKKDTFAFLSLQNYEKKPTFHICPLPVNENTTMLLFKKVELLQKHITWLKTKGLTIGFTPTMGALHSGHASLIQQSKSECNISVCSIFVNPTQFNEASDLEKYPRTIAKDIDLLASVKNDILFLPEVKEVYPPNLEEIQIQLGHLDKVMEGEHRPGHFQGVVQVVHRLLDIVQPHYLYMGQKDFQQFTIIQQMIEQTALNTILRVCPIKREADGLAMSSRNVRLLPEHRKLAVALSQCLAKAKEDYLHKTIEAIEQQAITTLSNIPDFKPEYFDIVDTKTLLPIKDKSKANGAVACTAVFAGEVRLIDNMILS